MFQREAIFVAFRVWLHEKELGPLERGYPPHQDVADMSNLFYFGFVFM